MRTGECGTSRIKVVDIFAILPGRSGSARLLALALVLAIALILRFDALSARGLIYWDEGKFLLEGLRLETALRLLGGQHGTLPVGKAIGTAKPTHALLIAISFALLGVHDYSALYLSAVASVGGIVLVYLIGTLLFDVWIGILAALALAVSEYDVVYARSALSESDATFFLLLGVYFWMRSRCDIPSRKGSPAALLAAGLLFGLAFSTNYRMCVYVAVVVGIDLVQPLGARAYRQTAMRGLQWISSCAVVPLAWQVIDIAARARGVVLFRSEITGKPATYLGEALYQIHEGKQSAILFAPLPYLHWYVALEGPILSALLVLGIGMAFKVRTFSWLAPAFLCLVPYGVFVWAPLTVPRNLSAVTPFTSILVAAGTISVLRQITREPLHLVLAVSLIAIAASFDGGRRSWRLSAERSGFARAAAFVRSHGDGQVLTTSEVSVFYSHRPLGLCAAMKVPRTIWQLSAEIHAGYAYALIDHTAGPGVRYIRHHMRRVARYSTTGAAQVGTNFIAWENAQPIGASSHTAYVSVFVLSRDRIPPAAGATAQPCNLNVL